MSINIDLLTWPGWVVNSNDGDTGYTDISGDLPSLASLDIHAVWSPCAGEAWAVGQTGGIWHLSGGSWVKETSHPFGTSRVRSIWGPDCDTVFFCGNGGKVATWTSGGGWGSLHTTPGTDTMKAIHGIDDQTLWCCGNGDRMIFTTNGGSSWADQATPFAAGENIQCVRAIDANTGIACGQDGIVIRTVNAGSTWTEYTTPNTATANWMWFSMSRDSNGFPDEIWVGQNGGVILFYDGSSWTQQVDLGTSDVLGILGSNPTNILACGGNGVFKVWHYDGATWTEILSTGTDAANAVAWSPGLRAIIGGQTAHIYESDAAFDLVGEADIQFQLGRQPTAQGEVTMVRYVPTGTSFSMDIFGSDDGDFTGEQQFLFTTTDDTFSILDLFSAYSFVTTITATAGASPAIDALQLQFLG